MNHSLRSSRGIPFSHKLNVNGFQFLDRIYGQRFPDPAISQSLFAFFLGRAAAFAVFNATAARMSLCNACSLILSPS
jgi:hypothetical protein